MYPSRTRGALPVHKTATGHDRAVRTAAAKRGDARDFERVEQLITGQAG
jgi:hypothetical protein